MLIVVLAIVKPTKKVQLDIGSMIFHVTLSHRKALQVQQLKTSQKIAQQDFDDDDDGEDGGGKESLDCFAGNNRCFRCWQTKKVSQRPRFGDEE